MHVHGDGPNGEVLTQLTGSNVVNGGQVKTTLYSSSGSEAIVSAGYASTDSVGASTFALGTGGFSLGFNGSTWDRVRNNTQGTLLASAARTATTNTSNQTNYNARGVIIFMNISAVSGSGGLTVFLYTHDPVTGGGMILANGNPTPITTTGLCAFVYYPGVQTTSTANGIKYTQSIMLPRDWYVQIYATDGSSYTYSLGYSLIL